MKKRNVVLSLIAAVLISAVLSSVISVAVFSRRNARAEAEIKREYYGKMAALEKEYILKNQLPEGVFLYRDWLGTEDSQVIIPYFSNIAARGLMSGKVSTDAAQGVRLYLEWYLDHLNTDASDPVNGDGSMSDYVATLSNGVVQLENTGDADSVDSYSATFLTVAEIYADKMGTSFLTQRLPDIKRVVHSILRIIDKNSLSQVSQDNPTQFLMDNCEVYEGLQSAIRLLERLEPKGALQRKLEGVSSRLKEGIEKELWDSEQNRYLIGLYHGKPVKEHPGEFYPDATSQLFPIAFDLLSPRGERAVHLYHDFCETWDWENMSHYNSGESEFYWCMLAYTAAVMDDDARVHRFLEQYYRILLREGRSYPLYLGEAGWTAMCLGELAESLSES